jgi:membrane protease YdiL (CAAX protease family)
MGLTLGATYLWLRSLWPIVIAHVVNNLIAQFA